ncbi:chymotrypsin inhibitor [Halictus rubicundus]|uniref:chymotrypsin inhibitor n=1 Tax=Halictus rubicundus TaxID=77578 RepID=UPI0040354F2B
MSRSAIFLLFVAVAYAALREVQACGPNEQFKSCASACEPKCGEKPVEFCIEECKEAACQCKLGYCRNAEGKCIPAKHS